MSGTGGMDTVRVPASEIIHLFRPLRPGQIRGEPPRLFNVYSEGNFIEATADTCYFQSGETKYGKPIMDRVVKYHIPLRAAAKAISGSTVTKPPARRACSVEPDRPCPISSLLISM